MLTTICIITKIFPICALAVFCFVIFGICNAQAQPTWTSLQTNAETTLTMIVGTPRGDTAITPTLDAGTPTARDFAPPCGRAHRHVQ